MSAVAAPIRERKPMSRPSASVRRMQSTPMGPTGAVMAKPSSQPLSKMGTSDMRPQ